MQIICNIACVREIKTQKNNVIMYSFRRTHARRLTLVVLLLATGQVAKAQFELKGEIRPRTEFRNGFKKLQPASDADYALFTEQRSRLYGTYKSDKIDVGLTIQDVRIWGEIGQINKSDGLLSVHEAWGSIKFSPKTSLKLGRQELVYDDQRVLGSLNWAAQGRSHDGARLIVQDSTWDLHLGLVHNQSADIPEPARLTTTYYSPGTNLVGFSLGNPKNMQFAWWNKKTGAFQTSILAMNVGNQAADSSVKYQMTFGINPSYKINDKLKLFGSFYYQLGKNAGDADVAAYLGSINLGITPSKTVGLTLGADFVSGNDWDAQSGTNTNSDDNSFDVMYGTHHKFYGLMDYFYVGNPHKDVGLNDFYLKAKTKTGEKTVLLSHLHYFMSNGSITDASGAEVSAGLGAELDLVFVYKYAQNITFKLGYSQLLGTDSMEILKGGDRSSLNNWAWLMININPSFFKS